MKIWFDKMNLQLMAEGAEGGTAETAGEQAAEGMEAQQEAQQMNPSEEFAALIGKGGKYHDAFQQRFQSEYSQRTKNLREKAGAYDRMAPMLAGRYGMEANDRGLADKVMADDSLLEAVAMKNGRSNDAEGAIVRERARSAELEGIVRSMMMQQDEQRWQEQAKSLGQEYPDINMDAVIADERVRDLLTNPKYGGSFDLKTAMRVVYGDQMLASAVSQTKQKYANAVASGQNRPRENGMGAQQGAVQKRSAWDLSPEEFRKMQQRAAMGERVSLGG